MGRSIYTATEEVKEKEMITLLLGDCLEKLKELDSNSTDSIVTDPPYELGFMGKAWDKTGIANNVDMWRECLRVLKPGGHLLAFSGTRTYHRMASAIEDVGFEVRDMIEWVYGSGFPKSLNIGKAVDKLQGNKMEDLGKSPASRVNAPNHSIVARSPFSGNARITKGTSEWEGWGTALKPAHEPICLARKPLSEKTVAENCLKWGTGGINIDESRVAHQNEADRLSATPQGKVIRNNFAPGEGMEGTETNRPDTSLGRFPANLIHDNSEEVRECFPNAGKGNGKGAYSYAGREYHNKDTSMFNGDKPQAPSNFNDSGNASRFFKSIIYQSKASKKDRGEGNNHATVKPTKLVEYLINMVTKEGQTVLDPFMGSGTTGVACKNVHRNFIGIEIDETYFDIAQKRINK